MVRGVEFIEAVPAELVLALGALHEFAALLADDVYLAARADFRAAQFVQVAEESELSPVKILAQIRQ